VKRFAVIVVACSLVAGLNLASAATSSRATITPDQPSVSWLGGPLLGAGILGTPPDDAGGCPPQACHEFTLTIDVPSSFWKRSNGGVAVRIDWPDRNDELDLHVFDPSGREVGWGNELRTSSEQTLIHAPAPGRYRVLVQSFHAANVMYSGRAWVVPFRESLVSSTRTSMRFAPATFVDPQLWVAEPGVWAASDGRIYATAPWSGLQMSSLAWRSDNGGRSFTLLPSYIGPRVADPRLRPCPVSPGGYDADIMTDRTGRLYFADLHDGGVTVGVSTDRGATWECQPKAASSPEDDRQWLAPAPTADGAGPAVDAYLGYRDFAVVDIVPFASPLVRPTQFHIDVTRDGGRNWSSASTFAAERAGFSGPLFTARDGTLYQVYQYESSVWLARSTDEGKTVRLIRVSDRHGSPGNIWLGGDVDRAGNVYVAWTDQGSWDVLFSVSRDKGLTWSPPVRVNPPDSETTVMPWLAAGKAGDVAIAWYGAKGAFTPTAAPASARWYVWAARSLNASSISPRFESARVSETPVRFGSLCLKGPSCENEDGAPADMRMLDFFEIAIAPDGAVVAAFSDTGRIQTTSDGFGPGPYVMFTRQTSGLGMKGAARAPSEPAGDVQLPDEMMEATDVFDVSGMPSNQALSGVARISLPLAAVGPVAIPSSATYTGLATDAYWLVVWKANDRVEYAGMHVDAQGNRSFFGGDQPVGIGRLDPSGAMGFIEKMASYPETFSLQGGIDQAKKQIWFDVPLARFHLRRGDLLHSFQAFTMTSLLGDPRTFLQPLYVVDATPAQTVRVGATSTTLASKPKPKPASRGNRLPATGVPGVPIELVVALLAGAALTLRALRRRPASASAGAAETG
jgi:hypothetical protein